MGGRESASGDLAARGAGDGEAPDFEVALRELERIVARLDADDVGLDEAMALFERGVARLRAATRLLDEARGRVEELIRDSSGALRAVALEREDAPGAAVEAASGEEEE
ncbi:MAG: exodeoxyribonuclease VII small subunit [Gemmatimonadota bacterium]